MASPRNKRKRKRGKGRLGPLFKLLCAGAVAVALTMVFTVVVCFVMRRHVRRISMVESMKAPE